MLKLYMVAKRHQLQSDRSLGVLLNDGGEVEHVVYLNDLPTASPELDALGREMGLQNPQEVIGARAFPKRKDGKRGKQQSRRLKSK